jgi:hypothetical protein
MRCGVRPRASPAHQLTWKTSQPELEAPSAKLSLLVAGGSTEAATGVVRTTEAVTQ